MSEIKLLPCPFCGGKPRVSRKSGVTGVACRSRYYRETIVCKCGASSKEHKAPGKAITSWNRRAALSSAAVAEREPYGYWVKHKLSEGVLLRKPSYIPEPGPKMEVVPLYLDPPPTSELEAEIERLRAELECALIREANEKHRAKIAHQNMNAEINARERSEARLAEALKALNLIDALDPEEHVYGCSADALRGIVIQMGQIARRVCEGGKVDG